MQHIDLDYDVVLSCLQLVIFQLEPRHANASLNSLEISSKLHLVITHMTNMEGGASSKVFS